MVKIRLKRLGNKKNPFYRIVVINSDQKREGAPLAELGTYNPKTKDMKLDKASALDWVSKGAQPSDTVSYLIKNCDDEGKLIYKEKTEKKLSKKALAKLEAEKEAKAAEEAAAQNTEEVVEAASKKKNKLTGERTLMKPLFSEGGFFFIKNCKDN